ncbi:MAG: phospholipase D-like domain-containing protein [Candidatus Margulisbacteria bacterium]|jgi:superfamily II DNA/RNA helicase/HKD family nuclease|nr:phospholipase D-like domain-containing protein [Candidatus Margulisiibacteriota bacterium]
MPQNTDLKFFTNEPNATLLDRFRKSLKFVRYFDILVGYFRVSGFYNLYKEFETIDKIRILVGLNADKKTYDIIEETRNPNQLNFSASKNLKTRADIMLSDEMEEAEETSAVEFGVRKFIEYLQNKKIEIRAYPSRDIHAKVYVSRYDSGKHDGFGSVITGSSNFSESGLITQREFNVELKDSADVKFALEQFEKLWTESIDVSVEYVNTLSNKTWINDQLTPYELYLKFLYEYFVEDISADQDIQKYLPDGFKTLKYQDQAVISAKKILEAYNGVFLADVVGLGKTFIAALLAQQLNGKILIICPPVLQDYWNEVFFNFGIRSYKVESLGKLEAILNNGVENYDYIFIDEVHRFRNELTQAYDLLHQICYGKKVALISATPLNNTINDILALLKLFQNGRSSSIPAVPNLENFFGKLRAKLDKYKKTDPEYLPLVKEVSAEIRDKVLKHVMVRRTRKEIVKYFNSDFTQQNLRFPELTEPRQIAYYFDKETNAAFNKTIKYLIGFTYARYKPLTYLKEGLEEFELQQQRNMMGFMKGILIKRLESSFQAFRLTVARFIDSYSAFIKAYKQGYVFFGEKIRLQDYEDYDNDEELLKLIESGKVRQIAADKFKVDFIKDLEHDLVILNEIRKIWQAVKVDPKLEQFVDKLKNDTDLKNNKLILFTESKETAEYLYRSLNKTFRDKVMSFASNGGLYKDEQFSPKIAKDIVQENYDPNNKTHKDDIKILITTDVLAEGINLHRANIIINYDLPWNPTRVMQRVGRINRVGTEYAAVHVYNFFPTEQSSEHISLEASIKAKIQAFHETLGEDSKYLTGEEAPTSHELFGDALYKRLNSKESLEDENNSEESELEYLRVIQDIRDKQPELFEKIKRIHKKARSAKTIKSGKQVVSFFRIGKLKKFYLADAANAKELQFFAAAKMFKCEPVTPKLSIPKDYYELLNKNKAAFQNSFNSPDDETLARGRSNENYVLSRLKANDFKYQQRFTEDDEEFVAQVINGINTGSISKLTVKNIKQNIEKEPDPLKMLAVLRTHVKPAILGVRVTGNNLVKGKKEVILSEYLNGLDNE